MYLLLIFLSSLPLLSILRVYLLLPSTSKSVPNKRKSSETCSLGVFMGSGGHTAEMKTLLSGVDFDRYTPRRYIVCKGDNMSLKAIIDIESRSPSSSIPPSIVTSASTTTPSSKPEQEPYTILQLPRARRVGQPPLSTLLSSLKTMIVAGWHIFLSPLFTPGSRPWCDVLLVNGPGTAVVIVLVCWIRRILGLNHTKIIYIESFARVKSLSLSGKLLRPFVDKFVIQWPEAAGPLLAPSTDSKGEGVGSGVLYRGWLV